MSEVTLPNAVPEEDSGKNWENIAFHLDSLKAKYDEAIAQVERLTYTVEMSHRKTAIVIGRPKNPASLMTYGPYCLEVHVPELGQGKDQGMIARAKRSDRGRVIIPEKGTFVNVYFDQGRPEDLIWEAGSIDTFESFKAINKEELASEAGLLALDPIVSSIDIFESNKDFKFLCNRTIPGLHKVLMELASPLGEIKLKTGTGGKIKIGDGQALANVEIDTGGSVKVAAGPTPLGTIDITSGMVTGADITLTAGLADIILDGGNIDIFGLLGVSISAGPGMNVVIKPGAGGSVKLGLAAAIPVNNYPACLFTGTPHSTSIDVKA